LLDKSDAELFKNLCSFGWLFDILIPLVYNVQDDIYNRAGINFSSLKHLDEIGLISLEGGGFRRTKLPNKITPSYYGVPVEIAFAQPYSDFSTGLVLLSRTGEELALVCGSVPRSGFREYTIARWKSAGLQVTDLALQTQAGQ
jgi:hypothetical protein